MALCPVCKTECGGSMVCPECGFDDVQKIFINREEAEIWFSTVVNPYIDRHYKNDFSKFAIVEKKVLKKYTDTEAVEVIIPNGIRSIGRNAFFDCKKIETVVIPSSVYEIESKAFYHSNLKEVVLPEGIEIIGHAAFYYCNLQSVVLPKSVEDIGSYAFYSSSLKYAVIPSGVETIGTSAFEGCSYVFCEAESKPDGWDEEWRSGSLHNEDEPVFWKNGWNYDNNGIPVSNNSYRNNDWNAEFSKHAEIYESTLIKYLDCSAEEVVIPLGIDNIKPDAFESCKNVRRIAFPEGITKIECCRGIETLEEVVLPKTIREIDSFEFANCTNLQKINIPENVEEISSLAFDGCDSLIDIAVSQDNKVFAFYKNCLIKTDEKLLILALNTGVVPEGVKSIGFRSFLGCISSDIHISKDVCSIHSSIFNGKNDIISISIDSLNTSFVAISNCCIDVHANQVVFGCKNSTIPEGTVSIRDDAFRDCYDLKNVVIPSSVTKIGRDAFAGCNCNIFCSTFSKLAFQMDWEWNWNGQPGANGNPLKGGTKNKVFWLNEWHFDFYGNPVPNSGCNGHIDIYK